MSRIAAFIFGITLCMSGAQAQLIIDGKSYRDPTQPAGAARSAVIVASDGSTATRPDFEVTFIRTGGTVNVAVINGKAVSVGDTVDGALVRTIEADTVTLEIAGKMLDISTFRAAFRTPAQ